MYPGNGCVAAVFCVAAVIQSAGPLLTRLASGEDATYRFNPSVAVLLSEALKLLICTFVLLYLIYSRKMVPPGFCKKEFLHFGVPAALYALQNILVYAALSLIPGSLYQVVLSLRIVITSILSSVILKQQFTIIQVLACVVTFLGAAQYSLSMVNTQFQYDMHSTGVCLSSFAAVTASLASIYTQWRVQLKMSESLLWQNVQLYLWGVATTFTYVSLEHFYLQKHTAVPWYRSFDLYGCAIVFYYVVYGLCISYVLKLMGSVQRVFIGSASIALTALGEFIIFNVSPSMAQLLSLLVLLCGIAMHNIQNFQPNSNMEGMSSMKT